MKLNLYPRVIFLLLSFIICTQAAAQISGVVYNDVNSTNRQDNGEKGMAGINVKAYNRKGELAASAVTDSTGKYQLSIPAGRKVRVEYTNVPNGFVSSGVNFLNGGTVQFLTSPKSNINVGIYDPLLFDDGYARVVIASYTLGSQKNVRSDTGTAISMFDAAKFGAKYALATAGKVGAIWGLAYDRNRERLYTSAFAKRHVGYGPSGPAGLYVIDIYGNEIKPLYDPAQLAIAMDADKHTGLGEPYMANGLTYNSNTDSLFFDSVGKTSFGGLDVSEDGKTLYVMNLYDRNLYAINLPKDGNSPVSAKDLTIVSLPQIGCKEGEQRPFAVKVWHGKVYVGVVCDASKSQKVSDLKAFVYSLDPQSKKFEQVFTMNLDYLKGLPEVGYDSKRGWYPWTDDFEKGLVSESSNTWAIYPQPLLSDIEFDKDGSMVLGFMDRYGHQGATGLANKNGPYSSLVESGGDIIRVAYVNGSYELENNGKAGKVTTKGAGNKQGPGGGEYYFEDHFRPRKDDRVISEEAAAGGLAILPFTGELLASHREPFLNIPWYVVHGIRVFDNQTGAYTRAINVPSVGFAKSGGVGDVELITSAPSMEIGCRVWSDCDEDGIQDADEPGIPNLEVQFWMEGKKFSQTQTDENGYFKFNEDNLNGEYLAAGVDYEIKIPLVQRLYSKGLKLTGYKKGSNPETDNDAFADDTYANIRFNLSTAGMNEYKQNIGFKCYETPAMTTSLECTGTGETRVAKLKAAGFNTTDHFDYSAGNSYEGDMDYAMAKPIPEKGELFAENINLYKAATYTVRVFNRQCYADFTIRTNDNKQCYTQVLGTEKEEEPADEILMVYPNPAGKFVNVQYNVKTQANEVQIELFNLQGQLIRKKEVKKQDGVFKAVFELSGLGEGTYLISISEGLNRVSKRFVRKE